MAKIKPFDMYTDKYERWFIKNKYAYQSELLAIKKALPKNGIGIEIGAGSGQFAGPLKIKFGIEPSKKMQQLAIKKNIKVIAGTGEEIPIKNDSFDFALMVTTICFLDDITKTLNETYRIIKEQGFFIVGFIDKKSSLGKNYQQYKDKNVFYKEAAFFSTDEILSYLKKAGFDNFYFLQTIFKPLQMINKIEPVQKGRGTGSFVVIKAQKMKRKCEEI